MIVGTGSIVVGIDSKGKIVRSGGWGGLISDEGSGFHMGISYSKLLDLIIEYSLRVRAIKFFITSNNTIQDFHC
jgi:hypothetical protein